MSDLPFDVTVPPGTPRGRTVKFTPERMEQIRNLVERGTRREEIAAIIGCSVGSLQVTCSRAGVSLRTPNSSPLLPSRRTSNGNGLPALPPPKPREVSMGQAKVMLVLQMQSNGRSREVSAPLPLELIGGLALEAEARGLRLNELLATLLVEFIRELNGKDGPEKNNLPNGDGPH